MSKYLFPKNKFRILLSHALIKPFINKKYHFLPPKKYLFYFLSVGLGRYKTSPVLSSVVIDKIFPGNLSSAYLPSAGYSQYIWGTFYYADSLRIRSTLLGRHPLKREELPCFRLMLYVPLPFLPALSHPTGFLLSLRTRIKNTTARVPLSCFFLSRYHTRYYDLGCIFINILISPRVFPCAFSLLFFSYLSSSLSEAKCRS